MTPVVAPGLVRTNGRVRDRARSRRQHCAWCGGEPERGHPMVLAKGWSRCRRSDPASASRLQLTSDCKVGCAVGEKRGGAGAVMGAAEVNAVDIQITVHG